MRQWAGLGGEVVCCRARLMPLFFVDKNWEFDIGLITWMSSEAAEKQPVTSYIFLVPPFRKASTLSKPCPLLPIICPQSSKTSKINFGQLVASAALWFKTDFIVSLGSIRMQSKYHKTPDDKFNPWGSCENWLLSHKIWVWSLGIQSFDSHRCPVACIHPHTDTHTKQITNKSL